MSRIRSKDTLIEERMKEMLERNGIKFREHPKILGNPDFLVEKRILVFCDGDFWHGYNYKSRRNPRKKFWKEKIEGNMRRDARVSRNLRAKGWSVLRFWEHDIERKPEICIKRIMRTINKTLN